MTILCYSRLRLQIGTLLFSLSAFGLIAKWWLTANVDPRWTGPDPFQGFELEWVFPIGFLISAAIVGRFMYLLGSDLAAIKPLPEGLQVTTFFGRRTIPWDGLIGGHRVNYGNLLHRNRWFNVRYMIGGATRAARVPLILTKRPSGGQMSLPEKIDKARDEALGQQYTPGGERIEGTGFDPDAAIQRYLRARAEGGAPEPGPIESAPPAEAAAPARPAARPAFGRKGL